MGSFGKIYKIWQNGEFQELSNFTTDTQILRFVNKSNNPYPQYADILSSGFDLRAWVSEDDENAKKNKEGVLEIILKPNERKLIHTGLYFDLPENTEIQVRSRSGMVLKYGVIVANTPGTVDEGYTGEVCVILVNLSKEKFVIHNGDRIAQGVVCPVYNGKLVKLTEVKEITKETERGGGGFGHTGFK